MPLAPYGEGHRGAEVVPWAVLAVGGRGVAGLLLHLVEDGGEQAPLRRGGAVGGFGQRHVHHRAQTGAEARGKAGEFLLRERQRLGQGGAEMLDHLHHGAQAGAAEAVVGGVERRERVVERGEMAVFEGGEQDAGPFPGRDLGADLVFLDHGGQRCGDVGGLADEGGNGGLLQLVVREQPPVAGDEAIGEGAGGGENLDRHAQAVGGDGEGEVGERDGVEVEPVAGEGGGVDLVEGDVVDGVHGPVLRLGAAG